MLVNKLSLLGTTSLFWPTIVGVCQAQVLQVIEDNNPLTSTQTTVDQVNGNFTITDGVRAGDNLFHSFKEFSVPENGSAIFEVRNVDGITNIVSRVVGNTVSIINGVIKIDSNPNFNPDLFLINPNGIVFGPSASLDMNGSFIASTASSIQFEDGIFSVHTNDTTEPSLLVSVPIGVQFGSRAERISNQAQLLGFTDGLNRTVALLGGEVLFDESGLVIVQLVVDEMGEPDFVPVGNIEIGSFAPNSNINLLQIDEGWTLASDTIQSHQNIQIENSSFIIGGNIQLRGGGISIANATMAEGSDIDIIASDSVELRNGADFSTAGPAGKINIQAETLIIDNALLSATSFENQGSNITLDISRSIELSNASEIQNVALAGPGGVIEIYTGMLTLEEGSQINSSTQGSGNAGKLVVHSTELITLNGNASGLFAITEEGFTGDAGNVEVTTGRLIVQDGAQISAETRGEGDGGQIAVNADLIELSGASTAGESSIPSRLLTRATDSGDAGNIEVTTGQLIVQDGARISAESRSAGEAGDIILTVLDEVTLAGDGSGLFANTEQGSADQMGGSIMIANPRIVIVRDGAEITVNSEGNVQGGNIVIQADTLLLDNRAFLRADTLSTQGGDILLRLDDLLLLRRGSRISASAGTDESGGDGGNIDIVADLVVAVPDENSDITANAFEGRGGRVEIEAVAILGLTPRSRDELQTLLRTDVPVELNPSDLDSSDITAISQVNPSLQGEVILITDDNLRQGLVELPEDISVPRIARGCAAGAATASRDATTNSDESAFHAVGRGGMPRSPEDMIASESALDQVDTRILSQADRLNADSPTDSTDVSEPIIEAQGLKILPDGTVMFLPHPETVTPSVSWQPPVNCPEL